MKNRPKRAGKSEHRIAVDLGLLRDRIKGKPKFAALCRNIDRYQGAVSASNDLRAAQRSLIALNAIQHEKEAREEMSQALMVHAVTFYVRATHADSDSRSKIDPKSVYTSEQKARHVGLVELRNKTFAHHSTAHGRYGVGWIDERPVLKVVGSQEMITSVYVRKNYIAEAAQDLFELIEVALNFANQLATDRSALVWGSLNELNDDLIPFMPFTAFEPETFFRNASQAEAFWLGKAGEVETHIDPATGLPFVEL